MLGIVFQHQELQIIKGVAKFPSDPNSAEQGLTIFDLQNEQYFTLKRNGYQPNIPTHEAVWGDSVLRDGRFPVTGREINVTETIRLTAKADSWQDLGGRLSVLNRFVQDCHDFWETEYQIEPVYLKWWAKGAPGEQYALLYKMDVIVNREDDDSTMMDVRIEIEREPFWRGLAPGANPILWTLRAENDLEGSDLALTTGDRHLVVETITNIYDFVATNPLDPPNKNFIEIDSTLIPGDAPALVEFTMTQADNGSEQLFIAQTIDPTSLLTTTGSTVSYITNPDDFPKITMLPLGRRVLPASVDACGEIPGLGSTVQEIGTTTTGSVADVITNVVRVELPPGLYGSTYAVFIRGSQTDGSAGDVSIRFHIEQGEIVGDFVDFPFNTGVVSGCTHRFDLQYLGTFKVPPSAKIEVSDDGLGIERLDTFNLQLQHRINVAATRDLEYVDVIILPLDLSLTEIVPDRTLAGGSGQDDYLIDNTGYFTHGQITDVAFLPNFNKVFNSLSFSVDNAPMEVRGRIARLIPNVTNRLHFLGRSTDGTNTYSNTAEGTTTTIRLNIIPRWRGIRDVK